MLFNSYESIFAFLPITLLIYFSAISFGRETGIKWLVLASLFFYGWWNPIYLGLILFSMTGNFLLGRMLGRLYESRRKRAAWFWLIVGVSLNLVVLGYFKYANFFVENINIIIGTNFHLDDIVLPLAISFFTFQQIAYLVDAYRGITGEYRFSHYALFVTFFPQLIAGPIVHHKEMLPQFMDEINLTPRLQNIAIGLTIFLIGLFKKAVLADGIAPYSTAVFESAGGADRISFFVAWGGALAYTLQLYFDFSGYSDMAIGSARLFGIKLPLNFHSPYKSINIIEFWRCWHMTLSRFLRDYLYIPLGGNRKGKMRRYLNLFVTMLLGGLWHGAGWTFVIWGGLHGIYLTINHAWRYLCKHLPHFMRLEGRIGKLVAWFITFDSVVVGWVFFRAPDLQSAWNIIKGMSGLNGVSLPNGILVRMGALGTWLQSLGIEAYLGGGSQFLYTYLWVVPLLTVALFFPNTKQFMRKFEPALSVSQSQITDSGWLANRLCWQPSMVWAVTLAILSVFGIFALSSVSEFLYFQF